MKLPRMESLLSPFYRPGKTEALRREAYIFQDTPQYSEEVDSVIDVRSLLRIFPLPAWPLKGKLRARFDFFMSL